MNRRRRAWVMFWRVVNPMTTPLAGIAPWWVLLETTGCRTGRARRTPLATGPVEADGMWLMAAHGPRAAWVRNIEANPRVRLRHRRGWYDATATVHAVDEGVARRFNAYARSGRSIVGIDPRLVRVTRDVR
jgi:deazaflavin-dependent oxidoreductase (nitroreductase family)